MDTYKLQKELNQLKNSVIGIFKTNGGVFELIMKDYIDSVDTIYITSFGAIHECHGMPLHYGKKVLFPDNKNMNEMLNDPFLWNDFLKNNF